MDPEQTFIRVQERFSQMLTQRVRATLEYVYLFVAITLFCILVVMHANYVQQVSHPTLSFHFLLGPSLRWVWFDFLCTSPPFIENIFVEILQFGCRTNVKPCSDCEQLFFLVKCQLSCRWVSCNLHRECARLLYGTSFCYYVAGIVVSIQYNKKMSLEGVLGKKYWILVK